MKRLLTFLGLSIAALASLSAQSIPPQESPELLNLPNGEKLLVCQGHLGRSYFLQVSDPTSHLNKWFWAPIIEDGADEEISWQVDGTADKGFFRIHHTDQVPGPGKTLDTADFDGDGISNLNEIDLSFGSNTHPLKPDTDGDGLSDGWERAHGLDPNDNGSINFQNGASGTFQGSTTTNSQALAQGVTSHPGSTLTDHDGDDLPNENDAAPQDPFIDWERSPDSTYAWIPVNLPAGYKPTAINNHLDVLGSLIDRDDPDQKFVIKSVDGEF